MPLTALCLSARLSTSDLSFSHRAGWDPLGLGKPDVLIAYREAELKHARLAMLAAVGWPLQEIFHPILVDLLRADGAAGVRDVLAESAGKSPSLLNGGLEQWEVAPALAIAVLTGSILELKDLRAREANGLKFNEFEQDRVPGDFAYDPLNIIGSLPMEEKFAFQEKELLNGRLAMIAVVCYVASEFVFDIPVIRFTPDLFQPLIFASDVRQFLDQSFSMASMDGSINGVAY